MYYVYHTLLEELPVIQVSGSAILSLAACEY